jgi:hypothetical protein
MAHFAEIKSSDNKILRVVVVSNTDVDNAGGDYSTGAENWVTANIARDPSIQSTYPETYWKQTSYNRNARHNYAMVGGTWDQANQAFVEIKPFDSWTLSSNFLWEPPVVYPTTADIDGVEIQILWDEANQIWKCYKEQDPYPMYSWNPDTLVWTATGENYNINQ